MEAVEFFLLEPCWSRPILGLSSHKVKLTKYGRKEGSFELDEFALPVPFPRLRTELWCSEADWVAVRAEMGVAQAPMLQPSNRPGHPAGNRPAAWG